MLAAKPFTHETMAKYFFYDANGEIQGPVSEEYVRQLVTEGIIRTDCLIEPEDGQAKPNWLVEIEDKQKADKRPVNLRS